MILLQIRLHLKKFNSLRLQKAGFFTNYFLGEEYFKFDKWKYGSYSHGIDIVARTLREYQEYYELTNSKDTYDHIFKVICSQKTENKLKKVSPAVEKSTEYINQITTDKKLEGIATALYIIQNNSLLSKEEVIQLFKEWSEDKFKRFSKSYIIDCIDYLEETNIIARDICKHYELSANIWN